MDKFIYVGDTDTAEKMTKMGFQKLCDVNNGKFVAVFLNDMAITMTFASAGIDDQKVHYSNMLYF